MSLLRPHLRTLHSLYPTIFPDPNPIIVNERKRKKKQKRKSNRREELTRFKYYNKNELGEKIRHYEKDYGVPS